MNWKLPDVVTLLNFRLFLEVKLNVCVSLKPPEETKLCNKIVVPSFPGAFWVWRTCNRVQVDKVTSNGCNAVTLWFSNRHWTVFCSSLCYSCSGVESCEPGICITDGSESDSRILFLFFFNYYYIIWRILKLQPITAQLWYKDWKCWTSLQDKWKEKKITMWGSSSSGEISPIKKRVSGHFCFFM